MKWRVYKAGEEYKEYDSLGEIYKLILEWKARPHLVFYEVNNYTMKEDLDKEVLAKLKAVPEDTRDIKRRLPPTVKVSP